MGRQPTDGPERRAFYEYHAALMEPWDGPAAIAFTDGRQIGATLDRNGLRPARYIITDDDHVILASESGVEPRARRERIVRKWRLQPGKMLLIDIEQGRIIDDDEIKQQLAAEHPYEEWLKATQVKLADLPELPDPDDLARPDADQRPGGTLSSCSRPSATPRRTSSSSSSRWRRRRRPRGLDGHRHADRGALEQAEAALQLFQAEFSPRSPTRRSIRSARNW